MIACKMSALSTNKVILRTALQSHRSNNQELFKDNEYQIWKDGNGDDWAVITFWSAHLKKGGGINQGILIAFKNLMPDPSTFIAFISPTVKENIDKMAAEPLTPIAFRF